MRMGRRVMALRVIGLSCGLLLAATLGLGEARAGGRGGAMAVAPHPTAAAPAHHPQSRPVWNAARWRQAAGPGFRHGVHRRWGWGGLGYADPWLFYPQAENSTIAVIERPVELSQPIDLDSFENLPARAGIRRGARTMPLGVCSQDALAEATGTAVHDQHEVTSVEPDPIRVLRIEKSLDTRQFHEVVAPAHRAQALGVTAKSIGIHHAPGWIVGVPSGIQCTVEIGEPAGETLGYGTFEVDGEHSDTAADVGSHQVRIQHSRRHGGTDGRAFPGVQVRHAGYMDHAVKCGYLVALRDGIGLDPASRGGKHRDGGRARGLGGQWRILPGCLLRQVPSLLWRVWASLSTLLSWGVRGKRFSAGRIRLRLGTAMPT